MQDFRNDDQLQCKIKINITKKKHQQTDMPE